MADYNIYIHDLSGTTQPANPTKAWTSSENSQTKAWAPQAEQESTSGGMGNLTPSAASFKGITKAIKAHPVVAAAAVVIATSVKIINTIEPFVTRETGDYRFNTVWNNIKASVNATLNPLGSALNVATFRQETRIFNERQEMNRMLIGEATVNKVNRRV